MRWFSWFESATHHKGDMQVLRMLLEFDQRLDQGGPDVSQCADTADADVCIPNTGDAQAELRALRQQHGTLQLIPKLITTQMLWNVELLLIACNATWNIFFLTGPGMSRGQMQFSSFTFTISVEAGRRRFSKCLQLHSLHQSA